MLCRWNAGALSKVLATQCVLTQGNTRQLHFSAVDLAAKERKRALPTGYRTPSVFSLIVRDTSKPGLPVTEIGRLAKQKYSSLSSTELNDYKNKAEKIGKERATAFEKLSVEDQEKCYQKQDEDKKQTRNRQIRKEKRLFNKSTGRPTKPPSAYNLYVKEQHEKEQPKDANGRIQLFINTAKQWQTMSASEKKPYLDKREKLFADYKPSVDKWKKDYAMEIEKRVRKSSSVK